MLSSPCQPAASIVSTRPLCFTEMKLCGVDVSQCTTSHHLMALQWLLLFFNKSIWLCRKNNHWHLYVWPEYFRVRRYLSAGQIKVYLLGLDWLDTISVGSCSVTDFRGLSKQKRICEISGVFALQGWHRLWNLIIQKTKISTCYHHT